MMVNPLRWLLMVSLLAVLLLPIHPQATVQAGPPDPDRPLVTAAEQHDRSRPLRELAAEPALEPAPSIGEVPFLPMPKSLQAPASLLDPSQSLLAPNTILTGTMPASSIQWDGVRNLSGSWSRRIPTATWVPIIMCNG